jgi:acetyl-CoA acyltransferase 1
VVIVRARRTPITRAKKGGLSKLKADQLLAAVLSGVMEVKDGGSLSRGDCSDIVVGNCLQPGGGQAMARMAAFEAGFAEGVSVASVNRQCSSGLQALAFVAGQIKLGV